MLTKLDPATEYDESPQSVFEYVYGAIAISEYAFKSVNKYVDCQFPPDMVLPYAQSTTLIVVGKLKTLGFPVPIAVTTRLNE